MLAALLGESHEFKSDPFWTDTASGLVTGLIAHIAAAKDPAKRSMSAIRKMLYAKDVDYNLAVLLDNERRWNDSIELLHGLRTVWFLP